LKSQFVKFTKQQGHGNDYVPDHIAAMNNWSSAPNGNDPLSNQQSALSSSPPPLPNPPRSGLLSNWNAGNAEVPSFQPQPPQQPGGRNLNAIIEQDTLEQRAIQPGPSQPLAPLQPQQVWRTGQSPQPVNPQAFMNGPVSLRESGITPYSTLFPNQPIPPALQTQPVQLPISQTLNPSLYPSTYGPNTNVPVMPMHGYAQVPMQPVGRNGGYPGAGGPPYIQPPMSPGNGGRGGWGGGSGGNGRNKRSEKRRRYPIWARVVTGIMVFLILLAGSVFAYYQVNFSGAVNNITNQQVKRSAGEENPNQGRTGDILSGPRINILLLGSDTDQKFGTSAGGATVYLAQTDIVVTIDPATKTVGMLSIPRDFYINIPGYGMGKLDEAFEHGYGMGQGGFAGAVDLSRQTIQQDFGILINYYAWVGLDGFVKVINTVGGVDVDVTHPITDDTYPDDVGNHTGDIYAYKRLYISPGPQHLSGPEALEYVRSRHADLVGDFGRSARQQQVLNSLKIKLSNSSIIGQLPQLANDLNGFVKTDMSLPDALKVANFARTLDTNKINRVILGPPYSQPATLPDGKSIVQPHCDQIIPVIAQMFALGNKAACNIAVSSSNSMLASAHQSSSTQAFGPVATMPTTGSPLADISSLSLSNSSDNMSGLHGLLDLLFAVVFESPQALQV
jgi:LCP family protein required for cell wall assembly